VRELVGGDIVPQFSGVGDLGQQAPDQVNELLSCSGDALSSMEEGTEFGALIPAVMRDEGVGLEHGFKPFGCATRLGLECGEVREVPGDVTLVPGGQDRFHIREVLVQRRASDAGGLGNL
jgi:hypothetical protein